MIYRPIWFLKTFLYRIYFGSIGFPSYLGKPLFLYGSKRIHIGKRVRIFPGMRAEVIKGGRLEIHDGVSIAQNFHVTCADILCIERNTIIAFGVMITDIDPDYRELGVPVGDQPYIVSKTRIGQNCFIGAGAKIQAGTVLGKQCIVGSNAVVRGTFPDCSVIVGAPARIVKTYDHNVGGWVRVELKVNS